PPPLPYTTLFRSTRKAGRSPVCSTRRHRCRIDQRGQHPNRQHEKVRRKTMKQKTHYLAGSALALALATGGAPALAQEVTLSAVSAFAEGTTFSKNFERFIAELNEIGKGVVQIDYKGGGGKVMDPFQLIDAVRTGVVDIGNLPGAFYTNRMPE